VILILHEKPCQDEQSNRKSPARTHFRTSAATCVHTWANVGQPTIFTKSHLFLQSFGSGYVLLGCHTSNSLKELLIRDLEGGWRERARCFWRFYKPCRWWGRKVPNSTNPQSVSCCVLQRITEDN